MISGLVRKAVEYDNSKVIEIDVNENDIPEERLLLIVDYMNEVKGRDLPKVPRAPDEISEQEKIKYYSNLNECYSDNYLGGFGDEELRKKCTFEVDPNDDEKTTKEKKRRHEALMNGWRYPYKPYQGDYNDVRRFVHEYKEKLNKTLFLHSDESQYYKNEITGEMIAHEEDVRYAAFACAANWFHIDGLISLAMTLFYGSKKLE
jgi:hypothetical protein